MDGQQLVWTIIICATLLAITITNVVASVTSKKMPKFVEPPFDAAAAAWTAYYKAVVDITLGKTEKGGAARGEDET